MALKEAYGLRREYPSQPVVGVGAVILNQGKILLVKRGVEPGKGRWSIPGGAVELGEGLHEALKREVREECGLAVEVDRLMDVVENLVSNKKGRLRFHYVVLDFLARFKGGTLKPASDVADAQWVPLDQAETYDLTRTFRAFFEKHKEENYLPELMGRAYAKYGEISFLRPPPPTPTEKPELEGILKRRPNGTHEILFPVSKLSGREVIFLMMYDQDPKPLTTSELAELVSQCWKWVDSSY
ncbi:MAG: NUDIX hydrolase, partial [Candidatus Bathyarchaeia archaeon]